MPIIFKWGRRDLKPYPGLWRFISIILASNVAAVVGTVLLELLADSVFHIFGGVTVRIILSSLGYHLVQRKLGYSLVKQIFQQPEATIGV